jgi:CheY-like chemotaxis protein
MMPTGDAVLLVALTGWGQQSDRDRARAAGFDYHLVKPVSLEALGTVLDTIRRPTAS